MRRILVLVLPILVVVAAGLGILGTLQVRSVRERLMDDLARKTRIVAESVQMSVRSALVGNNRRAARDVVNSFQNRERLQGCVIYNRDGGVIAITERIADWGQRDAPRVKTAIATKIAGGALETYKEYPVYSYVLPVLDEKGNLIGLVEVIYDTSYMMNTLAGLWRRVSLTLLGLVLVIVFVSVIVERQTYVLPVRRLTAWFGRFQRGEEDKLSPFKARGELGKLVSEIEQVALRLRVQQRAVSEQAHARLRREDWWTEGKLRDLVHAKLGDNAFIVVSNREPYMHVADEATGEVSLVRPASGVVTAIDPILRACGGTWIANGSGSADARFVNSQNKLGVPPEDIRYILKRVWLTKEEEDGYYYGFANEGLWPLCHVTHTRPIFRESDWLMYVKANRKFADSVLEELPATNPFVFIQDYHFTLLPQMIKEKRPDATVALFWHIPWPNPEVFAICPFQKEILEGMLGCDLIGFHVQFHCNNFLETANRLVECRVDTERFAVLRGDRMTFVKPFPISIDGYFGSGGAEVDPSRVEAIRAELHLEGKIVGVGVDRIDYTKGIVERILAVDRFLEKYPQYLKRFVFIQLGAPSRTHIKSYQELDAQIDELVWKKNKKYQDEDWRPIIFLKRQFSSQEIRPYYALGDICIVSSLHDGMNLVAKEYVATRNDLGGSLILSRFTGASRELADAILINPYSIEEFAEAIRVAVEMPAEEKRKRMDAMRAVVSENNVYRWAANIITELTALKKGPSVESAALPGASGGE
jgi:trehalose-6-phosphate synthase